MEDALSFIWASKKGLSETEIFELCGISRDPMAYSHWIQFHSTVQPLLTSRSGLINFVHNYIREAVQKRYLPDNQVYVNTHLKLADYFDNFDISPRKINELPYHLMKAEAWDRLADTLSDVPLFNVLSEKDNMYSLISYWTAIGQSSDRNFMEFYGGIDKNLLKGNFDIASHFCSALLEMGHLQESLETAGYMLEIAKQSDKEELYFDARRREAWINMMIGDMAKAKEVYTEIQPYFAKQDDKIKYYYITNQMAVIECNLGNFDKAREINDQIYKIKDQIESYMELSTTLSTRVNILVQTKNYPEAKKVSEELLSIVNKTGSPSSQASAYTNYAAILMDAKDYELALDYANRAKEIFLSYGYKAYLPYAYHRIGAINALMGNHDENIKNLNNAEEICRETKAIHMLTYVHIAKGEHFDSQGDKKEAISNYTEALELAREHNFPPLINEAEERLEKIKNNTN